MSRFRVANGMASEVCAAFASRPRLVDGAPGFLGLETYTEATDPSVFHLITRWTSERAFRAWHDSAAHHASHRFMPKGLRLDPKFTRVTVLDRIPPDARHELEGVVADASLLLASFFESAATTVVVTGKLDGSLTAFNDAFATLVGEPRGVLLGKSIWTYVVEPGATNLRVSLSNRERRAHVLALRLRGPTSERALRCSVDVHEEHFVLVAEPDPTVDDSLDQRLFEMNNELAVAARELTRKTRELEAAKAIIEEQARHDVLTGLFNRRYLFDAMRAEISRASRGGQAPTIVMLDLDHFKRINDDFGHVVGDAVLVATAKCVRDGCRAYDVAARYGGEELMVLLPATTVDGARSLAERLRAALARSAVAGCPRAVTASFGVAQWRPKEAIETWIERADRALYAAKDGGRDRVVAAPLEGDP